MRSFSKRIAILGAVGLIVAMVVMAPPSVQGQRWDKETRFSINQPFEVPGAVLEPNTDYVMRLNTFESGTRNVVQVLTPEGKLLTQFTGLHDFKWEAPDDTEFTFYETAPMYPKAIRTWFYPGANNGLEFIYPEDQMAAIVAHRTAPAVTETAVVTEPEVPVLPEVPQAEVEPEVIQPVPEPEIEQQADLGVQQPEEEFPQIAQNEPVEQPSVTETEPIEERELPRTAGELPMMGLVGMLCVGFGLGLRVLSARS
jgi:hypothetical protein